MSDKQRKTYCTIDHSNKRGESRNFDPYEYWLNQSERRKEIEALAKKNAAAGTVIPDKRRLA
tara:strand:- start:30267 stop:30452 length:186 start_codon:yes stop_codon:yes gene_type:complete